MPDCPNPRCGVEISTGTKFCPEYGNRVGGCRGCGHGLGGKEKFCPEGGAAVLAGTTAGRGAGRPAGESRKRPSADAWR